MKEVREAIKELGLVGFIGVAALILAGVAIFGDSLLDYARLSTLIVSGGRMGFGLLAGLAGLVFLLARILTPTKRPALSRHDQTVLTTKVLPHLQREAFASLSRHDQTVLTAEGYHICSVTHLTIQTIQLYYKGLSTYELKWMPAGKL